MKMILSVAFTALVLSAGVAHAAVVPCANQNPVTISVGQEAPKSWRYKYRVHLYDGYAVNLKFDPGSSSMRSFVNPIDVTTFSTKNGTFGFGLPNMNWKVYYDALPPGAPTPNVLVTCWR